MTSRRDLLRHLTLTSLALSPFGVGTRGALQISRRLLREDQRRADLLIIGGGTGGCAAALAACSRGLNVIMTEESSWIGGQFTAQAVPPDENTWIETIGGTRSYRQLRSAVRDHYRADPRLVARARSNPRLNPGNGWVSRVCAEPRVWLAAIEAQLAPHLASGRLRIVHHCRAVATDVSGDRIRAVRVRQSNGNELLLEAPYVVDATELGELSALAGAELVAGAESQRMTGEPHAPHDAQPDNQQSFTVVFAMEYRPREQHVIERPADYARWRAETVAVNGTPWPLLGFDEPANRRIGFDPDKRSGYWSYRRIVDHTLFSPGSFAGDITLVNWWQNDYHHGPLVGVSEREATAHIQAAGSLSLSLLHWLQTEAPRPDGGAGWPGLKLRPDIVGTDRGLAMTPYIRESRRLLTRRIVREQDVLRSLLPSGTQTTDFADSVGIGHYAMDLHRTTRGDSGGYGDTVPFQIPLGALVPVRMRNLLPACKNFGVTHLTNGCYRLHPIEWNVGEAVGHLVAHALATRTEPAAVHASAQRTADYQRELERAGIRLTWPTPLPAE